MPLMRPSRAVAPPDATCPAPELPELLARLSSETPRERRAAACELARFPEASQMLAERLSRESEATVREAVLTSLTRIGNDVAIAALVGCLRSEDAALRNEAIEAMQDLPANVAPTIECLLRDGDPDVRIFAVNVLESLRHPDVEKWLIGVIQQDPHVNVCASAVDLLGEVGSGQAVEPLTRLAARFPNEPYIQFATELALKRIGLS